MAERNIHRVTLRDVAKACGLSAPTVSQILNTRSVNFSSEETRRLVRETARQMGYQPNIGYKLMRGMTTKTVALILGFAIQREEEYVKELVFLLLNRLSSRGYAVYIDTMPPEWDRRGKAMEAMLQRGVEHFISIGKPCEWEELDALQQRSGCTALIFGTQGQEHVNVCVDVEQGVMQLLEHFRNSGCRRIRAISDRTPTRLNALRRFFGIPPERLPEYLEEIPGQSYPVSGIQYPRIAAHLGFEHTRRLLEREPDTDAILYLSDSFAIGGADYIRSTGRGIGTDIRLAGFNDTQAVCSYPFPISSVSHNLEQVADCIMEHFNTGTTEQYIIQPTVTIRD